MKRLFRHGRFFSDCGSSRLKTERRVIRGVSNRLQVRNCKDCLIKYGAGLNSKNGHRNVALIGTDRTLVVVCPAKKQGEGGTDFDPFNLELKNNKKIIQDDQTEMETDSENEESEDQSAGVRMALSALKFYKSTISPLLPASCRYIPTCSEYSMQAFQEFGILKGGVLTAWRLARCNPLGGKGYDPPKWPPIGMEAIFEFYEKDYSKILTIFTVILILAFNSVDFELPL